ncbi:hypothetical protein ENSA5_23080 [Enhygromyxa salina]|uniref:ATPase AAA-type core domain-containing protein n=1 Tax=Enhygromyxa salina TaxID=215803 RepID=A0A2S9YBJ2_9BACT|nr:AAA family ATPase [Enhygromyxa salina]PRQ02381.1 hypothetical protein ENSA5_23080 [Enhygromyxa salina]
MPGSITQFSLESYKAFDAPVELDLAPLTIVLGRNNAGKSALVRAPVFATSGFSTRARRPFDLSPRGRPFGRSLRDCAFDQRLTGLVVGVRVGECSVRLAAFEAEDGAQQIVEASVGDEAFDGPAWAEVRDAICRHEALCELGERIAWLSDERTIHAGQADDAPPDRLEPEGSGSLAWLHHAQRTPRGREGLDALTTWLGRHMGLDLEVRLANGQLECFVRPRNTTAELHPSQVGSGFRQLLPVLAALFVDPGEQPAPLLIIEHPELHLHPGLHGDIGELLLSRALLAESPPLLVESHSDALLLRARALVAEGQASKDDVAVYFVEPGQRGSTLRRIWLDEAGTPDWWPRGVFAEPTAEFRRIRRALNKGEGVA